jgi:hypothetical protein
VSALATMAAALATGLFLGLVLAATYVTSTRSHFLEAMQSKARKAERERARQAAEQLARRIEALEAWPRTPSGREWK